MHDHVNETRAAPLPDREAERLAALRRYNILDTPPEEAFDRFTQLAADYFDVPIALVSLVDEHRQWFKSRVGIDATETSRDHAFCAHAILSDDVCMVPDTLDDDRFALNPLVLGEPKIRFYAGAPLITSDGFRIGTLCVIAREPRGRLKLKERRVLKNLAAIVVRELEARREIVRRVETDIALRESESRFRGAFETSPHGMAIVAPDGRFLQVNEALSAMLGYSEAELLASDFQRLTYPEDLNIDLVLVNELLDGQIAHYSMEKRYVRKDGQTIWALLSVSLVRDLDGVPLHFVSQIKDIQDHKDDETQIAALAERNQLAIRAGDVGIWEWRVETGEHLWDAQVRRHFGIGDAPAPNSVEAVMAIVHPDDRERASKSLGASMHMQDGYEYEHRVLWPNGEVRHIQLKARIMRDFNGNPIRFIGTSLDVTELREAMQEAERASRAKSEFLTIMSHELRTPMNGILGFGQLLEAQLFGKLNDKQMEFAAAILSSGNHLLKLIDDVLELSKIEAGKFTVSMEAVDLVPVCKSLIASLAQLAARSGITVHEGDCGEGLPPVLADRTRLSQCLYNIGSNAIKYNRPGGTVAFSFEARDDGIVRISVTDTGLGIPEHRLAELFQPFNRLGAEQYAIEGSGVGLALTRRLAQLMGGSVGVVSEEGKGSTFWIDLQVYQANGAVPASVAPIQPFPSLQTGFKLLYVEDNPMNRLLVSNICAALSDATFIEAEDAKSGLAAARQENPDVIVLDINLPDQNGFVLFQQLRNDSRFANTPILALSANAMPEQIKQGLRAGFFSYLAKPIDVPTFIEQIASALEHARLAREATTQS